MMHQKVTQMDPDDMINMDQMPIPFSYHASQTLDRKGTNTIYIHALTSDTKRATLAGTVSGHGNLLKPLLIFKDQTNGRTEGVADFSRILFL
jgi:hypothetical protein